MPSPYRGRRLPRGLPVPIRRFLQELDLGLRDAAERGETGTITIKSKAAAPSTLAPLSIQASTTPERVALDSRYSQDEFLPGEDLFPRAFVQGGGKFHLLEPYRQGPTIYARDYGAKPDTGKDMTSALQKAFDKAPEGCVLVTEPGEWILSGALTLSRSMTVEMYGHWVLQNSISITADNTEIRLMPGCYVEKDPTGTVVEPFVFLGTAPTTWDNLTVDPVAGGVTITVTTPGNFQPGDWVKIRDAEVAWYEAPDPAPTFVHWETNRVRSIAGNVITLEYPLGDDYVTIGTPPSVGVFTPVVASGLVGPGKISNGSTTDATIGNAGARFSHCVMGYARGVEFFQCKADGLRYTDSYAGLIEGCYFHDATTFDGDGRGIVVRATHTLITNNNFQRLRHATDVGWFANHVTVSNNMCRGTAEIGYMTHPNVKWYTCEGNHYDGGYGYLTGGAEWGTSVDAAGIGIRQRSKHIAILNNTVENCRSFGIGCMSGDGTSDVLIQGNRLHNCNLAQNTAIMAAITVVQSYGTWVIGPNWVIEDNTILGSKEHGISAGLSDCIVRNNVIKDITTNGAPATCAAIYIRPYTSGGGSPAAISNIVVSGNDIEDSAGYGILIGNAAAATSKVIARGNKIKNTFNSGILAEPADVSELTIEDNTIWDPNTTVSSSQGGITVGQQSELDNTCLRLLIQRNTVYGGTSTRGIMTCVTDAKILKNVVYCPAANAQGIYIPSPDASLLTTGIVIEGNFVYDTPNGIYIGDTAFAFVEGTKVIRNVVIGGTDGIRMRSQARYTEVIDNETRGQSNLPIRDDTSVGAIIRGTIPAEIWGCIPGTTTDMTANIQKAFDNCPLGCTLVFTQGTYLISNQVRLSRSINVSAYGVVFDLGTNTPSTKYTTSLAFGICESYNTALGQLTRAQRVGGSALQYDTAAFVWGWTGSGNRPSRSWVAGLTVQRTAGGDGPGLRLHAGIVMQATFECQLIDTMATNFFSGLLLTATTSGGGCTYNRVIKHTSWNCRYSFDLYAVNGGWVNQNTLEDCRNLQSTASGGVAAGSFDKYLIEIQRVMMAASTSSRPNNNVFQNCTWESTADKVGRKLRLEASDCIIDNCRFEGDTSDITLIDSANDWTTSGWVAGGDLVFTSAAVATLTVPGGGTAVGTLTLPAASIPAGALRNNALYTLAMTISANGITPTTQAGRPVISIESTVADTIPYGSTAANTRKFFDWTPHASPSTTATKSLAFLSGAAATGGGFDLIITITASGTAGQTLTLNTTSANPGARILLADPEITVGHSDLASSNWQRNMFRGGESLATIVEKGRVEYLQSGSSLYNQGNEFQTGRANVHSGAGPSTGDPLRPHNRFFTTSTLTPLIAFAANTPGTNGTPGLTDTFRAYHAKSFPWSAVGMFEYMTNDGQTRNFFGMDLSSPYDLRTWAGMNIGNILLIRYDTLLSEALVTNPQDGEVWMNARTANGGFHFYNSNSSTAPTFQLGNASRNVYVDWRASNTAYLGSGHWGGLALLIGTGGSTVGNMGNGLCLHSTLMGGHADAYPIGFERGFLLNRSRTDADSAVRGVSDDNMTYWDASTNFVGFGLATPARKVDILDASNPQLRLTQSVGSSKYADIQVDSNPTLMFLPAVNGGGNYAVCFFGANESSGLQIQDEPGSGQIWIRRDSSRDLRFNLASGRQYEFNSAYATLFTLLGPPGTSGAANFKVPTAYSVDDASTNTVLQVVQFDRTTSAGGAGAGIGLRLGFGLDDSAGARQTGSEWDIVADTVTAGSMDVSARFKIKKAGSLVEALRLSASEAVFNEGSVDLDFRVEGSGDANLFFVDYGAANVGIGTNAPGAKLDVRGSAIFNEAGANVDFRVEGNGDANLLLLDANGGGSATGAVCIGTTSSSGKLNVNGDIRAISQLLRTSGGALGGVAGFFSYTSATYANIASTPVTTGDAGGLDNPTTAAQWGWLKAYDGTQLVFIPIWR